MAFSRYFFSYLQSPFNLIASVDSEKSLSHGIKGARQITSSIPRAGRAESNVQLARNFLPLFET
jgi:hypothetical protein